MARHWIEQRLIELNKSKADFARALGLPQSRVSELVSDRRTLKVEELPTVAKFLEISVGEIVSLLTGIDRSINRGTSIEIRGVVQAGHWLKDAFWPESEWKMVRLPVPDSYTEFRLFALEIAGNSMNEFYGPGTLLQCVSIFELSREPKTGEHVIVERRNEAGDVEVTCKEYQDDGAGQRWLIPRSSDPEHQIPLQMTDDTTSCVQVVALVIGSYTPR